MNYNGYGSLAGLTDYSQNSAPSYLGNAYGAYGAYRDVSGAGGYKYRQYDDGRIKILAGAGGVGTELRSGSSWNAITAEIGPYPAFSSSSVTITSSPTSVEKKGWSNEEEDEDTGGWFSDLVSSFSNTLQTTRPSQDLSAGAMPLYSPVSEKSKVPWGWIIGGTVGIGAVIAIAVMASKRGKK